MALDFGQNKEFDLARNRAKQQESANLQGQKEALARRAAQMGGGPSGAFVKQEQVAGNESAKRLAGANEGIDAMQAQETRRVNEIEQGQNFVKGERIGSQEFSRGERMGSQDFAAGQAKIGREYGTSERLSSQEFADQSRLGAQAFAQNERLGSQTFAGNQADLARQLQSSQFAQTLQQSMAAFEHEKYIDQKNLELADRMQRSNEKGGFMDNLFGGGSGGDGSGFTNFMPKAPTWAKAAIDPIGTGISYGKKKLKFRF